MAITTAILWETTPLSAVATSLYSSSSRGSGVIKGVVFTNIDTVTRELTVYIVPSGDSASSANIVIDAFKLAAGQSYTPAGLINQVINSGASVQAMADAANVINTRASGFTQ